MRVHRKTTLRVILICAVFLSLFLLRVKNDMIDFEVNYEAGKRLRLAETPYRFEDGHYMFKYLPSSAFLYLPLSYLPLDLAKGIWYFLTIFCSLALIQISFSLVPSTTEKSKGLMVLPPLILIKYFLREIDLGQINTLVTLILLIMIWYLDRQKKDTSHKEEIYSGLLWGVAIALKPYALIFLPYFLLKGKWRTMLSGAFMLSVALLIPSLYYGIQGNFIVLGEWISTLSQSTPTLLTTWDNISLIALFNKWTGDPALSLVLALVFLALLAFLVLILMLLGRRQERASVLECSVLLFLIPLASPLGWDYNLLMSILGIMIIVHNFSHYTKIWRILLVCDFLIIFFSVYDIIGKELYSAFMSLSITTLSFLLLIGYLAFLRVKKLC
ncbi:MAG: glycosyltransferase family 87 protein [Candidatus Aminicenantes bacterium]